MVKNPSPIITRWGGPNANHPPIITSPANTNSDLTLESKVLVQRFLSFHKHIYSYIATNGTTSNNVNCDLDVSWRGINQYMVSPTRPEPFDIESFFPPTRVRSVADVNAIASPTVTFTARRAVRENADCYLPWNYKIWKQLKDIVIDWLKKRMDKLALKTKSNALEMTTSVVYQNGIYKYEMLIVNRSSKPISGKIKSVLFGKREMRFEIDNDDVHQIAVISKEAPGEIWSIVKTRTFAMATALVLPKSWVADIVDGLPIIERRLRKV